MTYTYQEHDNRIRTLNFSWQKIRNRLSYKEQEAIAMFARAVLQNTPEQLIPNELIERAKAAMQKCVVRGQEVQTIWDMAYCARVWLNEYDRSFSCSVPSVDMNKR